MTTEIEKIFFDTFGIEPKHGVELTIDPTTDDNVMNEHNVCYGYPQITDSILLELIIILGTICTVFDKNVDDLKENVLKNLIELSGRYHIYDQVRTLFEEG